MEEKNKKQQYLIKLACVIAAFFMWIYITNVENPIENYKVNGVPVKIINADALAQSKLALLSGGDQTVTLTVRCTNVEYIAIKPEQFSLVVDLSAYVLKKGENRIPVQIVKSPNPDNIKIVNSDNLWIQINLDDYAEKSVPLKVEAEGLQEGYYAPQPKLTMTDVLVSGPQKYVSKVDKVIAKCDLKNAIANENFTLPLQAVTADETAVSEVKVKPEFINVKMAIKKVKSVGINIKTKGNLSKNMVLRSVTCIPDKIDIAGDEDDLRKVTSIDTEPVDIDKLSQGKSINASLVLPSGIYLVNSDGTVKVTGNFDKSIEKSMSVDIATQNASDSFSYTLSDTKVNIQVTGSEGTINGLSAGDITCIVDLSSLHEGDNNVPVSITLPDGVSKVSSSPETIKVVVKKKG